MPCYDYEAAEDERKAKELLVKYTGSKSAYCELSAMVERMKQRCDDATRAACEAIDFLCEQDLGEYLKEAAPHAAKWWEQHQKEDEERAIHVQTS